MRMPIVVNELVARNTSLRLKTSKRGSVHQRFEIIIGENRRRFGGSVENSVRFKRYISNILCQYLQNRVTLYACWLKNYHFLNFFYLFGFSCFKIGLDRIFEHLKWFHDLLTQKDFSLAFRLTLAQQVYIMRFPPIYDNFTL